MKIETRRSCWWRPLISLYFYSVLILPSAAAATGPPRTTSGPSPRCLSPVPSLHWESGMWSQTRYPPVFATLRDSAWQYVTLRDNTWLSRLRQPFLMTKCPPVLGPPLNDSSAGGWGDLFWAVTGLGWTHQAPWDLGPWGHGRTLVMQQ